MKAVGIRELKAKLSQYLREVQQGEVVLVTEHNHVVAEIRASSGVRALPEDVLLRIGRALTIKRVISAERQKYAPTGTKLATGTAKRLIDLERGE